jgi:hypothetical protein
MQTSRSDGYAERDVPAEILADAASTGRRVMVGADKAYDTRGFAEPAARVQLATGGAGSGTC